VRANTIIGAAANASPATALRLVIKFETFCAMITSMVVGADEVRTEQSSVAGAVLLFGSGPLGILVLMN
jgi:hypothetical protein